MSFNGKQSISDDTSPKVLQSTTYQSEMKILHAFDSTIFQAVALLGLPPRYCVTHLFCLAWKVTSCQYDEHPWLKGQRSVNSRLFQQCWLPTEEVGRKTRTDMTLFFHLHVAELPLTRNNEPSSFRVIRSEIPWELDGGWMNENLDHQRFGEMDGYSLWFHKVVCAHLYFSWLSTNIRLSFI